MHIQHKTNLMGSLHICNNKIIQDASWHSKVEIRSMERGICPIAVFYFALKRSFFITLLVNKGTNVIRFWLT